eukprot:CAMPEP_0119308862 /NCGR_PEP_ID=MMETSP1333-20130426/12813_1 /TAXON_ID=418940 /ORGANISM="Scyphosphaera apsteinii, Strain RCC1455" /LENGTH=185 /DNA_ID=CAMNT_0007312731 /DNA_START=23 /DNA_END=580 /DNA_ORIENTATION=+
MTSNPSDEQLDLVTSRIIDLAQALYPYVALDENANFDDAGFDDEMSAELTTRLIAYCGHKDGICPAPLEDQPTPRRMARYFLEEVDWEVLEQPLDRRLLSPPAPKTKSSSVLLLGFPRNFVLAIGVVVLIVLLVILFLVFSSSAPSATPQVQNVPPGTHHGGQGRHGGGRGKGLGFRNDSGGPLR